MRAEGRAALVTGAASGIGRATARRLAEAGARGLVLADIDHDPLERTREQITAEHPSCEIVALVADVTDTAALRRLFDVGAEHLERLDIVFNNAGIVSGPPPFPDTAPERIRELVEIDLTSVILATQMAIAHMRPAGGVIINTASTGGLNPYLADAPYAAAKAGVIMFSRSCRDLHASDGIRVNAVCPGVTETPILEKLGGGQRPDWLGPIMEHIRPLRPEDIAEAVMGIIEDDDLAGEYVVVANEPTT